MFDFHRLAVASPALKVADVPFNTAEIIRQARLADHQQAALILFPELAVSSKSCGSLFHQTRLREENQQAVDEIISATKELDCTVVFGAFLKSSRRRLANLALAARHGEVIAFAIQEHPDNPFFAPAEQHLESTFQAGGQTLVFDGNKCYEDAEGKFSFVLEIGSDARAPISPSAAGVAAGAKLILRLSGEPALAGSRKIWQNTLKCQSAMHDCAILYAQAGVGESHSQAVYAGVSMIAARGELLAETAFLAPESTVAYADVDFAPLNLQSVNQASPSPHAIGRKVVPTFPEIDQLQYASIDPAPFLPSKEDEKEYCLEAFELLTAALAERMKQSHSQSLVIGVSGGLDSTLALLVCIHACAKMGVTPDKTIAITMPGFGTTGRTYQNAVQLCRELGTTFREIDIKNACSIHFSDIGHQVECRNVTYENTQARERTQILMDIANQTGGMVVGTGDLSEIALGWCTYNGDHMSMYSLNASVVKSLIPLILQNVAPLFPPAVTPLLQSVIDTPVSPELLPAGEDGEIQQQTEQIIGPYELHDFFLYHLVKECQSPEKILFLAQNAFAGKYQEEMLCRTLQLFLKRFFQQQFKRSCSPDSPQIGPLSLSPGQWKMPSDASGRIWQDHLK